VKVQLLPIDLQTRIDAEDGKGHPVSYTYTDYFLEDLSFEQLLFQAHQMSRFSLFFNHFAAEYRHFSFFFKKR
jgi:hypothetical protein